MSLILALALTTTAVTQDNWTRPMEPFEIADDLYYVGSADLAAYLFASDEGHILLDAPLEENVDMIVGNIRRLGFDPGDIQILIASHAHYDHVGGLARMRQITGGSVVLSRADGELTAAGGVGPAGAGRFPAVRADRIVEHLGTVQLGRWTLTAQLTPGHTPGCTSWSGSATIDGAPVTFVVVCSLSVLGGYRLVGPDATFPGQGAAYCRSVSILRGLTPDLFLAPHGSFIDLEEKAAAVRRGDRRAFVDPEAYRSYLDRAAASIERTLAEQGHAGGCATIR
ncbi:MAG: subclass B3 metallo-beta-lactamase [Gemmatimonadales bacterium]